MSSLVPVYTHKHEIIPFHNTLMTNLSITYIFLSCLCLISLFRYDLSKSRLFTFYICFQFKVQDHPAFKLMHKTRPTSDLDVLYTHGKIRKYYFQCNGYHGQIKSKSPAIVETKLFSSTHRNVIFYFHKTTSLASAWTHKNEIIHVHNTLMTNLSITYIFLPCLCLISLFISNLSKSRLFSSHICFQFGVQGHLTFELTHGKHTTFDLDVLYMNGKVRR
jgi:hypothetical protein